MTLDMFLPLINTSIKSLPDLVGVVIPIIVDLVNVKVTNDKIRFLISIVVCILASVALKWSDVSHFQWATFATTASLIFAESQIVFKLYFKDSFMRMKLQNLITPTPKEEVPLPSRAI